MIVYRDLTTNECDECYPRTVFFSHVQGQKRKWIFFTRTAKWSFHVSRNNVKCRYISLNARILVLYVKINFVDIANIRLGEKRSSFKTKASFQCNNFIEFIFRDKKNNRPITPRILSSADEFLQKKMEFNGSLRHKILNSKSSKLNICFKIREYIFLSLSDNSRFLNRSQIKKFNFSIKLKYNVTHFLASQYVLLLFKEKNYIEKYSKLFEGRVFPMLKIWNSISRNKNAIPLDSPILRKGLTLWGDIPRLREHGNARIERGAHTEHEKARVVPLSRPPSAAPWAPMTRGPRDSPVSVRFHGNNVRHWRNGLFLSQQALPLPSDSPVPLRRCRSPPPAVQVHHRCPGLPPPRSLSSICDRDFRPPSTGRDWHDGAAARAGVLVRRARLRSLFRGVLPQLPSLAARSGRVAPRVVVRPQPISSPSLLHPHRQYGLISEGTCLPHASVLRFLREVN